MQPRGVERAYNEYDQRLSYKVTTATGSYGLQVRLSVDKGSGSVQSLPVTTWVTKDESASAAYLVDKGTAEPGMAIEPPKGP